MISTEIIIAAVLVIAFILLLDRAGRFLQRVSPKTLTYIDYGSFVTIIAAGALMYMGSGGVIIKYVLLISVVVYFIALRYTAHKNSSVED